MVNILSQNVRGLNQPKLRELTDRMKNGNKWKKPFAVCLQETWKLGGFSEKITDDHFSILNHGPPISSGQHRSSTIGKGVGIFLSPQARAAWSDAGNWKQTFGPRILGIRLSLKDQKMRTITIFLVSAYAPHSGSPKSVKEDYAKQLESCLSSSHEQDIVVMGTDANASLGKCQLGTHTDPVVGPFGLPHRNEAGKSIHQLLADNSMCAASTFFKKRHYATWFHPALKSHFQMDHFFVKHSDMKRVQDCGSTSWCGVDSDHRSILLRLTIAKNLMKRPPPAIPKFDLTALSEDKMIHGTFLDSVTSNMEKDGKVGQTDLQKLQSSILNAASESLPRLKRKCVGWFEKSREKLLPLIAARNSARTNYLKHRNELNKRILSVSRKKVKKGCAEAERLWIQEYVDKISGISTPKDNGGEPREAQDDLDEDRKPLFLLCNPKQAFDAIKAVTNGNGLFSKGKKPFPDLTKPDGTRGKTPEENRDTMTAYLTSNFDKDGNFCKETIERLNQRPIQAYLDKAPTEEEIAQSLASLKSGKASGADGVPVEMYKALGTDPETAKHLNKIITAYWKSGSYSAAFELLTDGDESDTLSTPTSAEALKNDEQKISFNPINPKNKNSFSRERYEAYKKAKTIGEAMQLGAIRGDINYDFNKKLLTLHHHVLPSPEPMPLPDDSGGVTHIEWSTAKGVLIPKGGDASLCKNQRLICLLDVSSKVLSKIIVRRLQPLLDKIGLEEQNGFTRKRGTADGIFSTYMALLKRKEHGLSTYVLFLDLVKAFDTVPREALFMVLQKFGLPGHFVNIIIRLHKDAKLNVKIGELEGNVNSRIGVRQGSCEGPVLFLFMMQAVMETLQWPEGVEKPAFMTALENGKLKEGNVERKRNASCFHLWNSMFADDLVAMCESRSDVETIAKLLVNHFDDFGMQVHKGSDGVKSKSIAMVCPAGSGEDVDKSNIVLDNAGHIISFEEKASYLGNVFNSALDATDTAARNIAKASRAFVAMKDIWSRKDIDPKAKGRLYEVCCLSILLYGSECWNLKQEVMHKLNTFHHRCVRTMCRVNMYHTRKHHIQTETLLLRLGLKSCQHYFDQRFLRWAGHLARMPMNRLPRKFLTSWIADVPRPLGHPSSSWVTTLEAVLVRKKISTDFATWSELAQDRSAWLDLLNDRPRRPKAPTQTLMSNQQRQTRSRTQGVPWQHATAHTEGLPLPRNRRSTRGTASRDNGMVNGFVALPRHLYAAVYGARASGGSEAN
jgi:hypothetical protein